MWIGEFSEKAGLNVATVRFYVRSGLLHPKQASSGGSRPYMEFSQNDLRTVRAIRAGQAMGMSLTEIKLLASERRAGGKDQMLKAMITQRDKLTMRADEIAAMRQFVEAKIKWLRGGALGTPPELSMVGEGPSTTSASGSARGRSLGRSRVS